MYWFFIVATRGDFAKILGFCWAVKQNLLNESHVLKQIRTFPVGIQAFLQGSISAPPKT